MTAYESVGFSFDSSNMTVYESTLCRSDSSREEPFNRRTSDIRRTSTDKFADIAV
jgi:hypothetical protein